MQEKELIRGFRETERRPLPEIDAVLHRYVYEKNGADLIWLERDDNNKTFFIAFKTIPEDDTGVFHILEHSVLCGSDKFPVREPFVELLKSSMQTFLNAFTYPDKTVYPVSTRNDKDFCNLIDVYMDAVFHPLSLKDEHAFRQEGWHYELEAPDGELKCNGVVYNEMKGAYTSQDTVLQHAIDQTMFPDNCYGFESGGHPEVIPTLSYENYCRSHRRYYHPSNSRIFLDGNVRLEEVLGLLDGYLSAFDRINPDTDIPMQQPVVQEERTCCYEIGEDEEEDGRVLLADAWAVGSYEDKVRGLAAAVLADVLCGSNKAPLSAALLDAGLCEDVDLSFVDGIQQTYLMLTVQNIREEDKDLVRRTVDDTVRKLVDGGLRKERILSVINRIEFSTREKDFGSMPRGLVYGLTMLDTWLYGGDPAQNLSHESDFAALRKMAEEDRFGPLLNEIILESTHHAAVCALPSRTLGQKKAEKEHTRLQQIQENLSEEQINKIIEDFDRLRIRQQTPDSADKLALLPTLDVSDIGPAEKIEICDKREVNGCPVLYSELNTDGIAYLNLYFSLKDCSYEELQKVSMLASLIGDLPTEHYSVEELNEEIEGNLGRFNVVPMVFAQKDDRRSADPYLKVSVCALEEKWDDMIRLTDEVLNHTLYDDMDTVFTLLRQNRISMEQNITASGHTYAVMRAAASQSARGAVQDNIRGIRFLRYLQQAEKNFEISGDELCGELRALQTKLFTGKRLVIGLTGHFEPEKIQMLCSCFKEAPVGENADYRPDKPCREGFVIPADVAYAAESGFADSSDGTAKVAAQMLTYDYLWNRVRVKGGAYGTGLTIRDSGETFMYSYRDPDPAETVSAFHEMSSALASCRENMAAIGKYIISTVAAMEPLMTPRTKGASAETMALSGRTEEEYLLRRGEILDVTTEKLQSFAPALEKAEQNASFCVIGGRDLVEACRPERVEALQQ